MSSCPANVTTAFLLVLLVAGCGGAAREAHTAAEIGAGHTSPDNPKANRRQNTGKAALGSKGAFCHLIVVMS